MSSSESTELKPQTTMRSMEEEMRKSYLDYSMSVIVGRALPDIRDGLKPVHRRVLYAMSELGNSYNRPYKKSARIVGDVIGKYHPHGDQAVYDTIVRMAQDFSMRYVLVDGQGNFGSVDGDSAAAMRYTEIRMAKLASELMSDIDKETVDFGPNYDDSLVEPTVLPARYPNLLVNGSSGIAVGMATNIPPHNLKEVIDTVILLIEKSDITVADILRTMPGPDFPTGATICGRADILSYYETGRGIVKMRAKTHFEVHAKTGKNMIVIDEIPYQVNKAKLIEAIADLVKDKRIEGISDVRDESDRQGMRVVVDLKRDALGEIVLNQLFKQTSLQTSFGVINLAIVNGQPKVLPIKDMLNYFIRFRREVVTRRSQYELKHARARFNILLGLLCALDNIDRMIALIRGSKDTEEARQSLLNEVFKTPGSFTELLNLKEAHIEQAVQAQQMQLNATQVQAILDMRLQRLTGLEREKLIDEVLSVRDLIAHLQSILSSDDLLMRVIVDELKGIRDTYGDERKTDIISEAGDISIEDLLADTEVVVSLTQDGYIKRNPVEIYRAQNRGGKGKLGITTKEEDFLSSIFVTTNHSYLLIFTNLGKLHWLKVHEIPDAGRVARGKALVNLIQLEPSEKVQAILPVRRFTENNFIVTATAMGIVKKTDLMLFSNPRASGIIACKIEDGDSLVTARMTDGCQDLIMVSKHGMAIRFNESDVRPTGRGTIGVWGINLESNDRVVALETFDPQLTNKTLLTVCENGFGKRTELGEYRGQSRGGKGVIAIKTSDRNGCVVDAIVVDQQDELMMSTNQGTMIRIRAQNVSIVSRNTQGVTLISLDANERVASIARIQEKDDPETTKEPSESDPTASS